MGDPTSEPTELQRRGMRAVIIGQVFGCLGVQSFSNGVLLLFLAKQGFGGASSLLLLSLPSIIQPILLLPLAHRADKGGRTRMAVRGTTINCVGLAMLCLSGALAGTAGAMLTVVGLVVFSIGNATLNAPWFSLLSTLVPVPMRGSFFGLMRVAWQVSSLAFGIVCASLLAHESSRGTLLGILAAIVVGQLLRLACLRRVPELDVPEPPGTRLLDEVMSAARAPGYAPFCCYVFLLTLFTANIATVLALVVREAAGFGDRAVVWMGNALMIGSVIGCFVGGRLVDRVGTKPVFLLCHGAFGAIFVSVLLRGLVPVPAWWWLGALNVAYGVVAAGSSVAISTEMLALAPREHKSVSTGLCTCLLFAGAGLAGLLNAGAIQLGIFSAHWTIAGTVLSAYDTILLLDAVLVVVLVVALGLVPSVMRPAELGNADRA
jgi:MFS family permease